MWSGWACRYTHRKKTEREPHQNVHGGGSTGLHSTLPSICMCVKFSVTTMFSSAEVEGCSRKRLNFQIVTISSKNEWKATQRTPLASDWASSPSQVSWAWQCPPKWQEEGSSGHFLCSTEQGSKVAPSQGLPSNTATRGKVSSRKNK